MVDLLKNWNPNKYMVDVEEDENENNHIEGDIVEDDGEKDIEFDMIDKLRNNWADNILSVINKLVAFDYDFTEKEIIYAAFTIIIVAIIYFILFAVHNMLKPKYPPPQEFYVKISN